MGTRGGWFRHVVQVERAVRTAGDFGEPEVAWMPLESNVRARVQPISATERLQAAGQVGEVSHRVSVRAGGGRTLRAEDRIVFDGRVLEVTGPAIDFEERGETLQVLCIEREVTA